jgi:hypothetical protein
MEHWKDIPGFEGKYQASTEGKIKRVGRFYTCFFKGVEVKRWIKEKTYACKSTHRKGYLRVSISLEKNHQRHFLVHTLVALTFIGPSNGLQVNHKNGIKTDNRVENLEYVTNQQNRDHAVAMGLHACRKKGNHAQAKLSFAQVQEVKYLYSKGMLQSKLSKKFNVCQQTISKIITG